MRFAHVCALLCLALCLCAPLGLTGPASADVLWDQLGDSGYGFCSQDFESSYDCYDCLTADDFTVPEPGWIIETVEFTMLLYYGGSVPVHGIHFYFMPDRGDNLGDWDNPVAYEFNPTGTLYDGDNVVTLQTPVELAPGHYFVAVQPALDFSSYSQCFFVMTDLPPVGQEAHMINPGGCFGVGDDWFQPSPGYDASFALYGVEAGAPDAVIDLPTDDVTILRHGSVEFAGTATDTDGEIVDLLWTFGEGSGIDDMHVEDPGEVQFNNPGVFTVTFNAQDNDGYWDPRPDRRVITVEPAYPGAVINLPLGNAVIDAGDHVLFAGTASDENGEIVDWLWTFGEGSGVDDMHVEDPGYVQFDKPGIFTVTFNAQDDDGNWDPEPDTRQVTVRASRLYVDKASPGPEHNGLTWDTAFLAIQDAVNVCLPGGEVWVADGTYVENVVMKDDVAIYGGFLGAEEGGYETDLDQRDWANHVATIDGNQSGSCVVMAVDARVDGFTITNGSGTELGGYGGGGGVYCHWLGEGGAIANNTIVANSGIDSGAGLCCVGSSPLVAHNTFAQNQGGYGVAINCNSSSSPTIIDNVMTDNVATMWGGALCCSGDSSPLVTGNSMTGNSAGERGGAIHCYGDSAANITGNSISGNSTGEHGGGGGIYYTDSALTIVGNSITGNSTEGSGGGIQCSDVLDISVIANNTIVDNSASIGGGGIYCGRNCVVDITNNTISQNYAVSGGGIICRQEWCTPSISNNIVAVNSVDSGGGGIRCEAPASPTLSHNDFWGNTPEDYSGCSPGEGDISEHPMFVDPDGGDFHLDPGSPCIDMGDNDAPELPETDFEGDPRIVDGNGDRVPVVDIGADECALRCWPADAPGPEPYSPGALFGEPEAGYPGWVWFSIPLDPSDCCGQGNCADPDTLLGFSCSGSLWYWDRYAKASQVYRPPFLQWDLAVGEGYLLRLESAVENPSYAGEVPEVDYRVRLGRQGWTWVGVPALYELGYTDFMNSVRVQYPVGGMIRTAGQDYGETPHNWVQWGWSFWDTYYQASRTFTPYLPFGCNTCYPWLGYRLWVNVGTAQSPDDPDQVTLIWP